MPNSPRRIPPIETGEDEPPQSYAETTPPAFAQPGHDFTLQAVMDLSRSTARLTTKVDRLIEDVAKLSSDTSAVKTDITRAKAGGAVALAMLTVVGAVFWWAIGDRITAAVRAGLAVPVFAPSPTDPTRTIQPTR